MNDSSSKQFGLMVAYLLPGFVGLGGLAPFVPIVARWLQAGAEVQAGVGPPVYAVLAATTIGMIISCFRWLIIDHIHRWTSVAPPRWNDERLNQRLPAFDYLVVSHYRYYQFVANALVALVAAYVLNRLLHTSPLFGIATDIIFVVLIATLFVTSRDALSKYYTRTSRLLGELPDTTSKGGIMHHYNGNSHEASANASGAPDADKKPVNKPVPAPETGQHKPKPPTANR